MLVKLTDIKDEVYWINPSYVRVLRWNAKKSYTEVHCVSGSGVLSGVIKIKESIEEIAMQLNVGMIGDSGLPPGAADAASTASAASNPALNAAMMG